MLVQSTFFLIFSDSWNLFTSFRSTWLQFLFWSFWSHLSSAESWIYSVSCYLLLYIIFLVCHLSISLPRGQDDYIIELHCLGHLVPYSTSYFFTSYFWCIIFRFRSWGGKMITSFELHFNSIYIWLFGASSSHFLCPCHLGHLITWGIMSLSFWHLCHQLIIWAHLSSLGI